MTAASPFTRVLTALDIKALLDRVGRDALMDRMIDAVFHAFHGFDAEAFTIPPRSGFAYDEPSYGLVEWMPLMRTGAGVTMKSVAYHPTNPSSAGLPTILSTIGRWTTSTGHLEALCEAGILTSLRTGAASAVASRALAQPNARVLGLLGTGAQAVSQAYAICRIFDIHEIAIHDIEPTHAASFPGRVSGLLRGNPAINQRPLDDILARADILCTATSNAPGGGPLFGDDTLHRPSLHINAVGSDFPGKIELPAQLLARAVVVPDFLDQARSEGECQQLEAEQIGPDLATVLQSPNAFGGVRDSLTVFDSTGFALEDDAALSVLLELAERHGIGQHLALEASGGDPLNPYDIGTYPAESKSDAETT